MVTASHDLQSRVSRVVMVAAWMAAASVFALLAAPLGYRLGIVPLRVALLILFPLGVCGVAVAAVLSLIGLVITMRRPRALQRGLALAAVTLLVNSAIASSVIGLAIGGRAAPPIHDITTDTQNPPEFVAVLPHRGDAPNSAVYGGATVASQQQAAYPDLQPVYLTLPPDLAFERALAAVDEMGWERVAADATAGRIEATDTTLWFGFKDDVVVRVSAAQGGSRVDIRSLSRVGVGDVGTNAKRIRAFVQALNRP